MRASHRLAFLVLVMAGCGSSALLPARREEIARGERLFVHHGCNGCHTVGVVGTPIGPDLSDIGDQRSKAWMERWLADPAAQQPDRHMPPIALPPAEARDLAAYLSTRR